MIHAAAVKLTIITAVILLPPTAVLFVLALGDTIHQGGVARIAALLTAVLFLVLLVVVQMLCHLAEAKGNPLKPTRVWWWGSLLSVTFSFLVLLAWLGTGRFNPPDPLLPRTILLPVSIVIWIWVGLMVLGVCLVMFDILRLVARRVEADVSGALKGDTESRRVVTFWPINRFIPELDLFPTDEQAKKVFQEARSKTRLNRIVRVLGLILVPILCILEIVHVSPGWLLSVSILILFALAFITLWLEQENIRRHLRQELRSTGLLLCIQCGYDLRGQIEPRCPECGTPFDMPTEGRR